MGPSASGERRRRAGVVVVGASAGAAVVWHLRPDVSGAAGGPDADIVVGCAWAAWLAAGYLCLAVAATAVSAARSRRWLGRLAPPLIRRAVESAVSVGLLAAIVGPTVAAAAPPREPATVTSPRHPPGPALDWPGLSLLLPSPPVSHRPLSAEPRGRAPVVVRAGDTLWAIAARQLGPTATTREVAASWPRWYAANRQLIGADPALIRPGERLTPPPAPRSMR
jgi:nucleoid-associated protein YgaU